MNMTLAQFNGFSAAALRLEDQAMGRAALAARVAAGAERKDFTKFLEQCVDGKK